MRTAVFRNIRAISNARIDAYIMDTQLTASSLFTDLKSRIGTRQARVGIIGLGYVGLPLASALQRAEICRHWLRYRSAQRSIPSTSGGTYIFRITPEEIAAAKANGFKATANYSQISEMDAIIICVPTPLNEYHEPDLSYITDTATAVAPHLRAGQIVILESTTYPGTTEEVLVPILEKGKQGWTEARPQKARPATTNSGSLSRRNAKIPATPRSPATIFRR